MPVVRWRFTDASDGDLAAGSAGVGGRRASVVDLPWTWLRQVHGARVVTVTQPAACAGAEADAAVTARPGLALAVGVADCAPVLLRGDGAFGVVHAGWRGLAAGVVGNAVSALRDLGVSDLTAVVGPCIEAGCYEFGAADLDEVVAVLGDGVRSATAAGRPALDVRAGVLAALASAGVTEVDIDPRCTACEPDLWSHRGASDPQRQVLVAWMES